MIYKNIYSIIEKENILLDDMTKSVQELRDLLSDKEKIDDVSPKIKEIEDLAFEFQKIDSKRNELIDIFSKENNIDKNIKTIVEFMEVKDSETAIVFANFFQKINDFMMNIDMLNEVINFQMNFNNLFMKLTNIEKTGKTTYGKKGYNQNNFNSSNNTWRG
ncbi:MAG: hypothetical protein PWP28_1220 [Oceanotoga sp.]|uniref:FlgN protein n=1 Tax=Oceanotoga teriensis TaxID=515440 RepID=A0AA45HHQ5_9BACT|nr:MULTISPECIES: flagellar export chaperone FlgN [Oceanotoga]MDN5342345.1 hypothetical protein [Oceanotoga sp.]PWJ87281.1 hypothetical protein C7380_12522 [Oceanotoga teriensis]